MIYPCQRAQVQFQFTQEIGQHGRNSRVYLAHDQNLDGQVVIKKIDKTTFSHKDIFLKRQESFIKAIILMLYKYYMHVKMMITYIYQCPFTKTNH